MDCFANHQLGHIFKKTIIFIYYEIQKIDGRGGRMGKMDVSNSGEYTRLISVTLCAIMVMAAIPILCSKNSSAGELGYETGASILTDGDGNIYLIGTTTSYGKGNNNVYVEKFDPDGNIQWYTVYGQTCTYQTVRSCAIDDDYLYVCGGTNQNDQTSFDTMILKFCLDDGELVSDSYWPKIIDFHNADLIDEGTAITVYNSWVVIAGLINWGSGNYQCYVAGWSTDGSLIPFLTYYYIVLQGAPQIHPHGIRCKEIDNDWYIFVAGETILNLADIDMAFMKFLVPDTPYTTYPELQAGWPIFWGGDSDDAAYCIELDATSFYTAGYTKSFPVFGSGSRNAVIVKYSFDGNLDGSFPVLWPQDSNDDETAYSLCLDQQNIYITGTRVCTTGSGTLQQFTCKFDKTSGAKAWERLEWLGWNTDLTGNSIAIYDGAPTYIYVTGTYNGMDALVNAFDTNGDRRYKQNGYWQLYSGESRTDVFLSIDKEDDDYIYLAGYTDSYGTGVNNNDILLAKYSTNGQLDWNDQLCWKTTWGASSDSDDRATSIGVDTSDGITLYIAGQSKDTNGWNAAFLDRYTGSGDKFQEDGNDLWKTWTTDDHDDDMIIATGLSQTELYIYVVGWFEDEHTDGLISTFVQRITKSDGTVLDVVPGVLQKIEDFKGTSIKVISDGGTDYVFVCGEDERVGYDRQTRIIIYSGPDENDNYGKLPGDITWYTGDGDDCPYSIDVCIIGHSQNYDPLFSISAGGINKRIEQSEEIEYAFAQTWTYDTDSYFFDDVWGEDGFQSIGPSELGAGIYSVRFITDLEEEEEQENWEVAVGGYIYTDYGMDPYIWYLRWTDAYENSQWQGELNDFYDQNLYSIVKFSTEQLEDRIIGAGTGVVSAGEYPDGLVYADFSSEPMLEFG